MMQRYNVKEHYSVLSLASVVVSQPFRPLWELTTNSARHSQAGMHIGHESRWVFFDLLDLKPSASILAVHYKTCGEGP